MKTLDPVELSFFLAAPTKVTTHTYIDAARPDVFAAISGDPAGWGDWFPGFTHQGRWVTPPPQGVGSVRDVSAFGTHYLETVLAWDTNERWAFRADSSSSPLFAAFAEDYRLVDAGDGTLLTWTVAYRTGRAMRLAGPLTPAVFGLVARRLAKRLARVIQESPGS